MQLVPDRVRPKPTSLTLVDMSPDPRMVYLILDALYTYNTGEPENVMDAIDYLEARLIDLDLPLDLMDYESTIASPENVKRRSLNVFQSLEED